MPKSRSKSPVRATVRGIADAAGVSIGSVSSVLNNRHVERRISPATVEKIRAAAAELGYLPNISARRLRRPVSASVSDRASTRAALCCNLRLVSASSAWAMA